MLKFEREKALAEKGEFKGLEAENDSRFIGKFSQSLSDIILSSKISRCSMWLGDCPEVT